MEGDKATLNNCKTTYTSKGKKKTKKLSQSKCEGVAKSDKILTGVAYKPSGYCKRDDLDDQCENDDDCPAKHDRE